MTNKEIRRSNQSEQGGRKSRTELIAGASWAWAGQDYRERVDLGRGGALLEGVVVRRSPRHGPFLSSCRFLALLRSEVSREGRTNQKKQQRRKQPTWTSVPCVLLPHPATPN
jgi:hypothetical protein